MKKRLLSALLALCMVLALLPRTAYAATTSGTCGANLQWNLNTSTMVLTITGSGAMSDYYGGPPWYEYASEIKEVVLSQSITYIGACAFIGCTALEGVNFPSRLTSIGYSAFSNCYGLTTVNIPDTVTSVGDMAFIHCTGLISARVPARVISNGDSIFSGCTSLTNITIPDGTTAIGYSMFNNCHSLTSVSIPNGVTRIGADAFGGCVSLETVSFPESLEIIEDRAFANCANLSHINFPDGLKSIGPLAFSHCTGLNSVIIPGTVTDMGKSVNINTDGNGYVFNGCTGLTSAGPLGGEYSIQYGWTDKLPAYAFFGCDSLTSVEFPDGMSEIGDHAFDRCTSLTNIEFPDGMSKIGNWAFYYCTGLTSIDLPDSMSEIGDYAFYVCQRLAKATLLRNISAIGENTFSYCYPLTIYCYQYSFAHQYAIAHNIPFVLLDGEPDQPGIAQILSLSPQSGAKDVSYDSENLPVFQITFDSPITSIEATVGAFSIYRASDDELLYSSRSATDFQFSGAMLTVTPDIQLKPATEYYVSLERAAIRFEDDAINPAIKKSQWNFTTEYFSTVENVIMATNYDSQKTANILTAWNDAWFTRPATVYNHDLATAAAVLSGAVYVDNASGDNGSGSIESALEKLGFDKILPYDFNYAYTNLPAFVFCDDGAVSFCLAVKEIENKSEAGPIYLLAIIVQGTTHSFSLFDGEWLSNLCTGLGTEHSGFLAASTRLNEVLTDYSNQLRGQGYLLNADNTSYFLTGHSRGAAVANLIAAQLSKSIGSDHVYAYTFATPTVSKIAQMVGYENIFNIINPDDIVPRMPLVADGYSRYGIDLELPSRSDYGGNFDAIYSKMNLQFKTLTGTYYRPGVDTGKINVDEIVKKIASKLPEKVEEIIGIVSDTKDVFQAHSMSLYYSWLSTCLPTELYASQSVFKRVEIACPVDVYVYDESNNIVACVVNEQANVNILAVSVENGEKTIDLPSDQEYSVKIVAREDGLVNYTVNELSTETTGDPVLRTVEFYDIGIVANDILTGGVNGILYTDAENYALTKNGKEVIYPDSDSLDSSPSTPSYQINALANPSTGGRVWIQGADSSSGTFEEGTSVTVMAEANSGYRFVRWTENSTTVSADAIYTFNATKDRTPTAVFEWSGSGGGYMPSNPSYQITVPPTSNGTVTVMPTSAKSGTKVTITATPDSGYTVGSVTVKDSSGKNISVTDNGNGTYTFAMPTSQVTVSVAFVTIEAPWVNPFTDMSESDWFYDGVAYVAQNGLMQGVGDGKFNPSGTTTRGMIVTILYRLENEPTVSQLTFTDVVAGQYYTEAVAWAAVNKIVEGYGNNTFGPNDDITREQMATILYRYAVYKGYDVSGLADLSGYTDAGSISSWAVTAMRWANSEGLIGGRTTTTLIPKGTAIRAEAATILMRFCQSVAGLE